MNTVADRRDYGRRAIDAANYVAKVEATR